MKGTCCAGGAGGEGRGVPFFIFSFFFIFFCFAAARRDGTPPARRPPPTNTNTTPTPTPPTELGVLGHPDYKLVALLDHAAMVTVSTPRYGVFDLKPLAFVWAKFPGAYGPTNTVMLDDLRRNFLMNRQQGLARRCWGLGGGCFGGGGGGMERGGGGRWRDVQKGKGRGCWWGECAGGRTPRCAACVKRALALTAAAPPPPPPPPAAPPRPSAGHPPLQEGAHQPRHGRGAGAAEGLSVPHRGAGGPQRPEPPPLGALPAGRGAGRRRG